MNKWKLSDVKESLKDLPCKIIESGPGGDWDLNGLQFQYYDSDYFFNVTPFKEPNGPTASEAELEECDIYAVEVSDGRDSSGGCNSDNEDECAIFAMAVARLRKQGFNIINHYDEIF